MNKIFYSAMVVMCSLVTSQNVNAASEKEDEILFQETFAEGTGEFTTEGYDIWKQENGKLKMIVTGMVPQEGPYETSYFVSPVFEAKTGNYVSFEHDVEYCWTYDFETRATVAVRTVGGEWKALEDIMYPFEQGLPSFMSGSGSITIPAEFDNQKIQVAFGYTTNSASDQSTWYIQNLLVRCTPSSEPVNPGEMTDIYSTVFDSEAKVFEWKVEGSQAEQSDFIMYNDNSMQINGYIATEMDTTNYVVSPKMTLGNNNTVEFNHRELYFYGDPASSLTGLVIRTVGGEWKEIKGFEYKETNEFYTTGELNIPAEFNGKEVEFGFHYLFDGTINFGYWYIKDFKVRGAVDTSIDDVEMDAVKDNKIYDLQGRVVTNPSEGLYIINGKKTIVK